MRSPRIAGHLLLAAVLLASISLPCEASSIPINLATWSIQHGCSCSCKNITDLSITVANFAKFVAIYDVQVVGLTDVDWMAERSGNADQALELCQQMPGGCEGLETFYSPLPNNATGSYGIAAVSNAPLGQSTSELFNSTCYPGATAANGHGILAFPVTISNYTFHIITVHAPGASTGSQFPRYCQAAQIVDFAIALTNNFTDFHVIMGDFKSGPTNQPFYNYMAYYYVDAFAATEVHESPTPNGCTWSTCENFVNGARYDSIWIPKQWAAQVEWLVYATPDTTTCSDHVPVVTQFFLNV